MKTASALEPAQQTVPRIEPAQTHDQSNEPLLSLIVSTVGRPEPLERLIESLCSPSETIQLELIVVDQSVDQRALARIKRVAPPFDWLGASSGPGVSVGRNVGLRLARGQFVGFPNDRSCYRPDTLTRALTLFRKDQSLQGLSGRQLTPDGRPSMLRWPDQSSPVTRRNFYRTSISGTLFLRREQIARVGSFDETIGTGSNGRIQAGEESDLILRALNSGARIEYHPEIVVIQDDPRDTPDTTYVARMHGYGYGQGHLWRSHHLSAATLARICARKIIASLIRAGRGELVLARADLAYMRGCIAGFLRRGMGSKPRNALPK